MMKDEGYMDELVEDVQQPQNSWDDVTVIIDAIIVGSTGETDIFGLNSHFNDKVNGESLGKPEDCEYGVLTDGEHADVEAEESRG